MSRELDVDEDGWITTTSGKRFDPSTYHARPGYLQVGDQVMRICALGKAAERYDKKAGEWVTFPDRVALMHSNRLTDEEARKIAEEKGILLDEVKPFSA